MRGFFSIVGLLFIAAIWIHIGRDIAVNNANPRPGSEAITRDLLAAIPDSPDYAAGRVSLLNKTIAYSASVEVETSDSAAGSNIKARILANGWKQMEAERYRVLVFCKRPMVLEVYGPTRLDHARSRFLLRSSWGSYFAICE